MWLIDWNNLVTYDLLDPYQAFDEKFLIIRRLIRHRMFVMKYFEELQIDITPSNNWIGYQKFLYVDELESHEFNLDIKYQINPYVN